MRLLNGALESGRLYGMLQEPEISPTQDLSSRIEEPEIARNPQTNDGSNSSSARQPHPPICLERVVDPFLKTQSKSLNPTSYLTFPNYDS